MLDDQRQLRKLDFHARDDFFDAISAVRWGFNEAVPGHPRQTAGFDPVEQPFVGVLRIPLRRTAADGAKPMLVIHFLRTDRWRDNDLKDDNL